MTLHVSRESIHVDGVKACSRCGKPRDQKNQRLCKACHRDDMRDRRAGKYEVLLTPQEYAVIMEMRGRGGRPGRAVGGQGGQYPQDNGHAG